MGCGVPRLRPLRSASCTQGNPSRRFLGLLGAASAYAAQTRPDVILHSATIHTVDPSQPSAQAVAIAGDRLLAVGANDEVLNLAAAGTKKINLSGKTVVPGFIDAHTHPVYSGIRHLCRLDADLRSIQAIKNAIRTKAADTPKGEWVVGFKYDDTKTEEGRKLVREDLDEAAPNHPVLIQHRGGHTAYVNSLAMKIAGITEDAPDPAGGHFVRDSVGRLTGGLEERATELFEEHIPSEYTRDDYRAGAKLIFEMM